MVHTSSWGKNRISAASGDFDNIWLPRKYRADATKVGIVLCRARGTTATTGASQWKDATTAGSFPLAEALAELGSPVVAADLGGQVWGNSTAQSRLADAKTYLQGSLGAKAGPIILVTRSMGNAAAITYAKNNPTAVKAIAGSVPVSSLSAMYTSNRGGWQTEIGTAWGVTYPTALPADADLVTDAASLTSIPYHVWYSSDDTTVLPAEVTALATAMGGTATSVGALGHTEASTAAALTDLVAFVRQYI